MSSSRQLWTGSIALLGGCLALALAPVMVAIKYMTGWAIIAEPFWVATVRIGLAEQFPYSSPAELWMVFGTAWSFALLLMLVALLVLGPQLRGRTLGQRAGYWLVVGGLALVLPGDVIHTWTWHQDGLTVPTPGSNPLANTAYATHMMGMNLVMIGTMTLGISALRRHTLARWLAVGVALVFPAALFASIVILPTTPSGALWLFSLLIAACGYFLSRGRGSELLAR